MDLFELLFIALFIIFPILDGVLKQRRKGRGGGDGQPGPESRAEERAPEPEEPRPASEMVPDDLWELMTGERRSAGPRSPEREGASSPWSDADVLSEPEPERAPDTSAWEPEPWMDETEPSREPVSLEYEGPEAYSLETPAPEPIERTVPSAEARHRAFHRLIDRPKKERKRRMSPLMESLRSRDGLRQAVLLKEILGPPKGLE